jgi:hypothetical protein
MSLPAHVLRQLLASLKTDATRRAPSDKRSAPRVGLRHPTRILPVAADPTVEPITAWVRNLSAHGVGLLARHPVARGTEFLLTFDRPDAPPLSVLYRATRVAGVGLGLFSIGGRFICVAEPTTPVAARAIRRAAS